MLVVLVVTVRAPLSGWCSTVLVCTEQAAIAREASVKRMKVRMILFLEDLHRPGKGA
jgi:hypothetical protein